MSKPRSIQRAFNAGEISRLMFGRVGDIAYQHGVAQARSFIIDPTGAARNRPGLEHVADAVSDATQSRLIEFTYSADQQLIIEIGAGFFRFHVDGSTVLFDEPASVPAHIASQVITGWVAVTGVATVGSAHGLADADPVYLTLDSGTSIPDPFEERQIYYAKVKTTTTFALSYEPGGPDITDLTVYGGSISRMNFGYEAGDLVTPGAGDVFQCLRRQPGSFAPPAAPGVYWQQVFDGDVYQIPNIYNEDDLFELTYEQSLDVMTICHLNYPMMELRRRSSSLWVFSRVEQQPQIAAPGGVAVAATEGNYFKFVWNTASANLRAVFSPNTHNAAALGFDTGARVKLVSADSYAHADYTANPIVDEFVVRGAGGGANDIELSVVEGGHVLLSANITLVAGTKTLRLIPSLNVSEDNTYKVTAVDQNGAESLPSEAVTVENNLFAPGAYNTVTWSPVGGASRYNIYRLSGGQGTYGLIGTVDAGEPLSFKDLELDADLDLALRTVDTSLRSYESEVSFDTTDDEVDWVGNDLRDGDRVQFVTTDTLATPLVAGTVYYVVNRTVDAFQVADTLGGAAINLGGTPAGTHFATAGDFPGAVGNFEQRRIFAGTLEHGQRNWMTRTGTRSDMSYTLPVRATDRVRMDVDSKRAGQIRHIVAMDELLELTDAGELRLTPRNTDAITPESNAARAQSYVGSSLVTPVAVINSLVYCAARGGHIREMGYQAAAQGFVTGDLSLRAAHLFDNLTIIDMAVMRAPRPIVWCVSSNGVLLGLTYVPDERVIAWHWHDTSGVFESVAVITEGQEDRLYAAVRRTINGVTKRFIERMGVQANVALEDAFHVDGGSTYDFTPTTSLRNLTHLQGQTVVALADGIVRRGLTVVAQPAQICTFDLPNDEVDLVGHGFVDGEQVTFATTGTLPAEITAGKTYYVIVLTADTFQIEYSPGSGAIGLSGSPSGTNTVTGSGRLTLPTAASKVHVGLPYRSQLKSLPIALQVDAAFGKGRTKNIEMVWVDVDQSAPFYVGQGEDDLAPTEPILATLPALVTDAIEVTTAGEWDDEAQVVIRQDDPLPVTVVDITMKVALGD